MNKGQKVTLESGDVVLVTVDLMGLELQAARAAVHNATGVARLNDGLIRAKVVHRVTDDWRTARRKRREREQAERDGREAASQLLERERTR